MTEEEGDTKFVSCLDKASLKKAKDELSERNDKDRVMAVQTLRQWINDVKTVRTPTDISFLLRFLRVKKFSQLEARKRLENYWTGRTKRPEWFRDMDPLNPDMQKAFRSGKKSIHVSFTVTCMMMFRQEPVWGWLCFPKKRDKHNRRVLFMKMSEMSVALKKEVGLATMFKTLACTHEWLVRDEHVQVNGYVLIEDYSNLTMQFVTSIYNADDFGDFISFFQNGLPARVKGLHMFNEPPFFDFLFSLISPFLSQKLRSRFHFHGRSLVNVYDDVGYECFPDEYLPDDYEGAGAGPIKDCIEEMIADMVKPEFRDYILDLSSDKYGVDKDKIAAPKHQTNSASYRKLNID